ncbi:MAG: response regulator [Planctomycetales bacterium]|nr:response regulator [Planctomycetales bacterium]
MNTLVVDDSNVVRLVIRRALAQLGLENVDEAGDGKQAIELVESTHYHLVVVDWNMPEVNGIDVIRKIREMGNTCPIVMQTTNATKSDVMEALRAGATDYILKPFTTEEMVDKLDDHMLHGVMMAELEKNNKT